MKIECPECHVKLNLDETKIPEQGTKAKCPKCGGVIFVKRPDLDSAADSDAQFVCPGCGYPQKAGRECVSCGLVFEKYERSEYRDSAATPPPPPLEPPPMNPAGDGSGMSGPQPPPIPEAGPVQPTPTQPLPTRMAPAILVTLFCCLPTGVAAIIYAARVRSKQEAGDYEGAKSASRTAGILCLVSLGMGFVTIAVIGILAAIAIPQFVFMRQKAQDAAAMSALSNLKVAQETYFLENDEYGAELGDLSSDLLPGESVEIVILAGDEDSWSAWAQHYDSPNRFTYSSSDGGLLEHY